MYTNTTDALSNIIYWMDCLTIVFAFFAMIGSGLNWWSRKKDNDKIKIFIKQNGKREPISIEILRKHFTRAEVQGVLGVLNGGERYDIKYLLHKDFSKNILDVQNSKKDFLEIILEKGETLNGSNEQQLSKQN